MKTAYRYCLSLIFALQVFTTISVHAEKKVEPFLRVAFVPANKVEQALQPGFSAFPLEPNLEMELRGPLTHEIDRYKITISGAGLTIPDDMPQEKGRLISRWRSLSDAQRDFPYGFLYRSWVAGSRSLTVQIEGLKPATKYKVRFYVMDPSTPENEKRGSVVVHDALKAGNQTDPITYDASVELFGYTATDKQSAVLESTSNAKGALLYCLLSTDQHVSPILNGFEVEEVK